MSYGWIIDKDHFADGKPGTVENAVGTIGPGRITAKDRDQLMMGKGHQFRMFNGDNVLIYEGRLIGDHESEDGFGPLDDFGTPNFGCTSIEYLCHGKWEML